MVSAVVPGIYISYCLSSHGMATATTTPGLMYVPYFYAVVWLMQAKCPLTLTRRCSDMYREDVEEEGVRGNGWRSPYTTTQSW
jgi:hypothetical protein